MRNESIDRALEASLSRERLSGYLADGAGDLDLALSLYERNGRLAEALHGPLQSVEISLRNALHRAMLTGYGDDWMNEPHAPLGGGERDAVTKAIAAASRRKSTTIGAIVAELSFGFWVGLMGPGYDQTLWRRALHRAFPHARRLKRSEVHGRFNMIRRLRNRVAHHEPVHRRELKRDHHEIIEAIGWICPHTAAWTAHHSRLLPVIEAE